MHVSFGELVRIAPEAIRMLGYPYGHADDCVEGIVWTQSVLGRGYELLRMADGRRPPAGWPAPSISEDGGRIVVELAGGPAFSLAARLADLAQATAVERPREPAVVVATGAFGGWIAPYVAARVARAGLHAAVAWHPGASAAMDEAPPLTIAAPAATDETVRRLLIAPGSLLAPDPEAEPAVVPARLLEIAVRRARAELSGAGDGASRLVMVALRPARRERVVERAAALPDASAVDVAARQARAIDEGLDVAREDHAILTGLSQRIRLPDSERSRNQAG